MRTHHQENVLEVRADCCRAEGLATGLLEHDGHNIVADMTLPQELGVKGRQMRGELCAPPAPVPHLGMAKVSVVPHLHLIKARGGYLRRWYSQGWGRWVLLGSAELRPPF